MSELKIDESIAQIEDALLREISFAMRRGIPPAATPAALRLQPAFEAGSPTRADLDLVYVTSLARRFYWWQASTADDDDETVIKPLDAGPTGRWLIVSSTLRFNGVPLAEIEDGVLREVILYEGDFSWADLNAKIFGRAPCVAIHFDTESHKAKSLVRGALYDYRVKFEIWSVAKNYRDRFEASIGSEFADELADDPGALRIHGRVKKFLAGSDLGLGGDPDSGSLDYSGVDSTEILDGRLDYSDLKDRVFVMALNIEVRGSLANPDAALELRTITRIDAQREQSSVGPTGKLDLLNCVTSGLEVQLGMGFAKTIAAGFAKIDGTEIAVDAFMHTFTASTVTYRDLAMDGTWTFVEVKPGYDTPEPAEGMLRIAATTTDSAGIVGDAFLASSYIPSETPDQIEV